MTLNCIALCEEMFDYFPPFDETLRHIELCNTIASSVTYSEIHTKTVLTVWEEGCEGVEEGRKGWLAGCPLCRAGMGKGGGRRA